MNAIEYIILGVILTFALSKVPLIQQELAASNLSNEERWTLAVLFFVAYPLWLVMGLVALALVIYEQLSGTSFDFIDRIVNRNK